MTPRDLLDHKRAPKWLAELPEFKPQKRNKLPRPFHRIGGSRIESTGLIDVSDTHVILFVAKDGVLLTDTGFYAHLLVRLNSGSLSPIFEFHWHPSHKSFHCKTPCRATQSYTDRTLAQAAELNMKTDPLIDPRKAEDRVKLVNIVCRACGIALGSTPDDRQGKLWK